MKSMRLRMKTFLHKLNSSLNKTEKMISAFQGRSMENMQRETPKEKSMGKSAQDLWDDIQCSKIIVTEVLEKKKENGKTRKKIFKRRLSRTSESNENITSHIQEYDQTSTRVNIIKTTHRHYLVQLLTSKRKP